MKSAQERADMRLRLAFKKRRLRAALDVAAEYGWVHGDDCPHRDCNVELGEECAEGRCEAVAGAEPCAPERCSGSAVQELWDAAKALLDELGGGS